MLTIASRSAEDSLLSYRIAPMDVSQFKDDVVKIIRQSDLEKVSARSVRKTLEAKLDIDLSSVKVSKLDFKKNCSLTSYTFRKN